MEIHTLQGLPSDLFNKFTDDSKGLSEFSQLRTSQTGNERIVTKDRLNFLQDSKEHIMLVAVEDETLMGMVVGQRITGIGNEYFYVHDIVIHENARGRGLGTTLMQEIIGRAQAKWPEIVRIQLTSRPQRGTGPFFEKCGFRPRTEEAGDPTVVYVKDRKDYTS